MKDPYNLVADGMVKLFGALAAFETSVSGGVVRSGSERDVRDAMALLERLVDQDIEVREDGGATLKQGVARDRIVSVHAPEMRHGRKPKKVRFDGHKGALVVDADSGVILEAGVKAGNAHDAHGSLEAIERAEETLKAAWEDAPVEEGPEAEAEGQARIEQTLGDCAYGTADNRRAFAEAGRELTAKQPPLYNGGRYTQEDFPRDEDTGARTCPAGHSVLPARRACARFSTPSSLWNACVTPWAEWRRAFSSARSS